LFSYVSCEARVAKSHPLRAIGQIVDAALLALSPDFEALYARLGRPSIPPEKLLRALLLQAFYSVRSERQLMEQLDYNLLFRWFVGLSLDTPIWDASVFTKNRDRLVDGEVAAKFMAAVLNQPRVRELLSAEHFSVKPAPAKAGGTLIEAWASIKSFRPKDGSGEPPAVEWQVFDIDVDKTGGTSVWKRTAGAFCGVRRAERPCRCRQRWMPLRDSLGLRQRRMASRMSSSGRARPRRSATIKPSSHAVIVVASRCGRVERSATSWQPFQRATVRLWRPSSRASALLEALLF
jgi:transposase